MDIGGKPDLCGGLSLVGGLRVNPKSHAYTLATCERGMAPNRRSAATIDPNSIIEFALTQSRHFASLSCTGRRKKPSVNH